MKRNQKGLAALLVGFLVVLVAVVWWRKQTPSVFQVGEIALLLPDNLDAKAPLVQIWESAAREEGLRVVTLRDNDVLRPGFESRRFAGLIVPDTLHPIAGDALVLALQQYVQNGGKLMLTYDAATWQRQNLYRPVSAAFSSLVGVDYALYSQLKAKTMQRGALTATPQALEELEIPWGKTLPYAPSPKSNPAAINAGAGLRATSKTATSKNASGLRAICAYSYPVAQYPGFVTRGAYSGKTLLSSPVSGLMAGYRPVGKGGVLFVNLPLGYLKSRTDGLFLHTFLRYFANRVLEVARTSSVPDGVGGLTMNWHVDSNADIKPLFKMKEMGFYEQGPYSIHFTAGPDTRNFGDKMGVDIPRNVEVQNLIRDMSKRGHAVGSHGGWIHDYYGKNANEDNKSRMLRLLELNKKAVEAVTKKPLSEYSAPEGNQPIWSTKWLDENNIKGYYFTGNTGLGPTRSFRNGQPLDIKAWSFPIATLGVNASFEEFYSDKYSSQAVQDWLKAMSDYTADNRTNRLIYFHPHDIVYYPNAMKQWLAHAAMLQRAGRFRWYTMTQLAEFLNTREQTQWNESLSDDRSSASKTSLFAASNAQGLAHQTWLLPRARYEQPTVTAGAARVGSDKKNWLIVAKSGNELKFSAKHRENAS